MHALNSPVICEAQLGDQLKQKYIPGELSDIIHYCQLCLHAIQEIMLLSNGIVLVKLARVSFGCGNQ